MPAKPCAPHLYSHTATATATARLTHSPSLPCLYPQGLDLLACCSEDEAQVKQVSTWLACTQAAATTPPGHGPGHQPGMAPHHRTACRRRPCCCCQQQAVPLAASSRVWLPQHPTSPQPSTAPSPYQPQPSPSQLSHTTTLLAQPPPHTHTNTSRTCPQALAKPTTLHYEFAGEQQQAAGQQQGGTGGGDAGSARRTIHIPALHQVQDTAHGILRQLAQRYSVPPSLRWGLS